MMVSLRAEEVHRRRSSSLTGQIKRSWLKCVARGSLIDWLVLICHLFAWWYLLTKTCTFWRNCFSCPVRQKEAEDGRLRPAFMVWTGEGHWRSESRRNSSAASEPPTVEWRLLFRKWGNFTLRFCRRWLKAKRFWEETTTSSDYILNGSTHPPGLSGILDCPFQACLNN